MRRLPSTVLAALALAVLAGCGQSNPDLIPASNAKALQETADAIQAACNDVDRGEARRQVAAAENEIASLPRDVDPELKQNLQEWMDHIESQIKEDCRAEATPTPKPSPTEAPTEAPTATATASPAPTEAPTVAPTEAPTQPPVETPTAAPTEGAPPPAEPTPAP